MTSKKFIFNFSAISLGGGKTHFQQLLKFLESNDFNKIWTQERPLLIVPKNYPLTQTIEGKFPILRSPQGFLKRSFFDHFYLPIYSSLKGYTHLYCPTDVAPLFFCQNIILFCQNSLLYQNYPYQDSLISNLRIKILRNLARRSLKKAKKIIFVSQYVKNLAIKISPSLDLKSTVIHHGFENQIHSSQKDQELLQQSKANASYLLSVSSFYYYKNFEDLIIALNLIDEKKIKKLILVSPIVEKKYYLKIIKMIAEKNLTRRISIITDLKEPEVLLNLYKNALVYVNCSKEESFGLTPMEALQQGTPCILSNIQPFQEIYSSLGDENCSFYEIGNSQELAKKILQHLDRKSTNEIQKQIPLPVSPWNDVMKKTFEFIQSD